MANSKGMISMLSAWGITDKGAVRQQNQDAFQFIVREDGGAGVVCDGMGGARAGNVASSMAVETFCEVLTREEDRWNSDPRSVLAEAAEQANGVVFAKAGADSDCHGMGTTLVSVLLCGEHAYILNIGDSRAYHISRDGISRITRDHSVVEDLVSRGELTPEQARLHPQKNLITRALGAEEQVKADLYEMPVTPGEFLLLCTDGLSNTVTDQEILYEAVHGGAPEGCCSRLLDISLTRGAPDNVTVVLFQI